MLKKIVSLVVLTSMGLVVFANGCSGDLFGDAVRGCCPTDPNDPRYDDIQCTENRDKLNAAKDAGYDGAGCVSVFPGFEEQARDEEIATVCVPNAPDKFDPPQPLWVGPKAQDPGCPPEIGAFGDRRNDDLVVPGPGCPKCVCGPIEGSCSPRPNNIFIRADFCDVLQTYLSDFSAPENWDGSCTNLHAMPANAECPAASGVSCAQAIYTSALPDPVEGCAPIPVPIPKAHSDEPTWSTRVLSCNATPIDAACPDHDSERFAALPAGWRHCVRHRDNGIHECPSDSKYKDQVIAYSDAGFVDTRQCTECECKASGGTCYGTFNVYEDEQCTKFVDMEVLNSETYSCSNLMPGAAVGSKEVVDVTYAPGKCAPTGGLAIGTVEKDDADAVTWCCLEGVDAF
jgi:hypothetical protein